jgi:hypothetical protein
MGANGIVPQFNYGAGFATAFNPTYAATKKEPVPLSGMEAVRHDSYTTSGLSQNILERIDRVFPLDFPTVPSGDLGAWDAFISWAIAGGQFQYYPDASNLSVYVVCKMTSLKVPYKYVAPQTFAISFDCRIEQVAEIGS